ncbi:hypothetical protein [Microviridae sp.]|nr:hypothetical protein [Microviridae sp.]
MGMSTPGPATSLKESSGLGAGISNAAQTIAGAAAQKANVKALRARAENDEAQATYWQAMAAKISQEGNSQPGKALPALEETAAIPKAARGLSKVVPHEITSPRRSDISTKAGPAAPGREEMVTGYDRWGAPRKRKMHQATKEEWSWLFDLENAAIDPVLNPYRKLMDKAFDKWLERKYRKSAPYKKQWRQY